MSAPICELANEVVMALHFPMTYARALAPERESTEEDCTKADAPDDWSKNSARSAIAKIRRIKKRSAAPNTRRERDHPLFDLLHR